MKTLLIACPREEFSQALAAKLADTYDIHICCTGAEAAALIDTLRPDAMVLSLRLVGTDGLTVLAQARYKPPQLVALTDLVTPALQQAAAALGATHMFRIPCRVRAVAQVLGAPEKSSVPSPGK